MGKDGIPVYEDDDEEAEVKAGVSSSEGSSIEDGESSSSFDDGAGHDVGADIATGPALRSKRGKKRGKKGKKRRGRKKPVDDSVEVPLDRLRKGELVINRQRNTSPGKPTTLDFAPGGVTALASPEGAAPMSSGDDANRKVDSDGYLIDEHGNRILDANGNPIKLNKRRGKDGRDTSSDDYSSLTETERKKSRLDDKSALSGRAKVGG